MADCKKCLKLENIPLPMDWKEKWQVFKAWLMALFFAGLSIGLAIFVLIERPLFPVIFLFASTSIIFGVMMVLWTIDGYKKFNEFLDRNFAIREYRFGCVGEVQHIHGAQEYIEGLEGGFVSVIFAHGFFVTKCEYVLPGNMDNGHALRVPLKWLGEWNVRVNPYWANFGVEATVSEMLNFLNLSHPKCVVTLSSIVTTYAEYDKLSVLVFELSEQFVDTANSLRKLYEVSTPVKGKRSFKDVKAIQILASERLRHLWRQVVLHPSGSETKRKICELLKQTDLLPKERDWEELARELIGEEGRERVIKHLK